MYLTNTRPDICFVVNTLCQHLVEPIHVHLIAAKQVMRYLKGMLEYGLCYTRYHDFRLYGYTDSDWAGSVSDRKGTSGCCFQSGVSHDFMAEKEEINYFSQHDRSKIHCNMFFQELSQMALEVVDRYIQSKDGSHHDSM
jgi:hypothetical protein